MIFMTHPLHGAMNVYSPADSLTHQKNGWVESTPEKWLGDKAKPVEATPIEEVETTEAPKKRGRPAKAE